MLNLAQWKMKHENYVLKTNWKKLILANRLKENMVIQVWSIQVDQKLCLAVVRI
ncbi:putative DNA-binding pseudobarrel domain superfamily [Helianthus anomalus]